MPSSPDGPDAAPRAARRPRETSLHGDTRVDEYDWLRERDSSEVRDYLQAENRHAEHLAASTAGLRQALYEETVARVKLTDVSVPYRRGDHLYYSRTEEGRQYPVYCRRHHRPDAPEEILLDLNAMAEGRPFLSVGTMRVSPDGRLLAYTVDVTGFRDYTLRVKNLETGEHQPGEIASVKSVAWAADSATFFYTVDDAAKRPYRLYRRAPGVTSDALLYEERDERFRLGVHATRSREWIVALSASHTTTEIRVLPTRDPGKELSLLWPRCQDIEVYLDHGAGRFFLMVNDTGRNFRLVEAPQTAAGDSTLWREIVPQRDDVMIEDVDAFADHLVVKERQEGLPHLRIIGLHTGTSHRVGFPEPAYTLFGDANAEFEATTFRFGYESAVTPRTIYEVDLATRERRCLKQTEVIGYESSGYATERLWATAPDGVQVPVTLAYRKTGASGPRPTLLLGYGAYGYPYPVVFDPVRVGLLDRGLVVAIAHVRGGGELGKRWHDDGRVFRKKNTFTDFIAVAEHLIATGVSSPDRLAASGGSAGGLLMGAVANMRPDLFRALALHVPFVDVLTTMLDTKAPLTVGEFEEWGNPEQSEAYGYIKSYCPYTNIAATDYPALLVTTSLNDSQVMYWEPAKYVARLRATRTDRRALLFKTNLEAGHGGPSGRYDHWRDDAFNHAFILDHLGIRE